MPHTEKAMSHEDKHRRGIQLFQEGQFLEAVRLLGEALGGVETSERWNDWATVQLACHRAAESEQGYRRAVELDPGNGQAAANLGILLASLERPAEAIPFLEQGAWALDEPHRAAVLGLLEECRKEQVSAVIRIGKL